MKESQGCPVVAIGASAGGLEALKQFLHAMRTDSGAAFVLIQHLDPKHESLTAEILARCTTMDVVQVDKPMSVEPNRVYVIPPNAYLSIHGDTLSLSTPVLQRGLRMPVDNFLRSLAEARRERSIGIIVSGTGSDGTLGIKAIKAYGGLAIAQSPESAQYDGMPRSAVATGLVDIECPIEAMPEALCRYLQHAYVREPNHPQALLADGNEFRSVLALLRTQTGHDFRPYKKGTLGRRIARRMSLHHIETLNDYVTYIRAHPDEARKLRDDLLIGVTAFFRDTDAFTMLASEAVTRIVQEKATDEAIRIWVPACASGEEAYSIAIAFLTELATTQKHNPLQVFATDIDETALSIGRAGIYPHAINTDVDPQTLRHFFTLDEDAYRVNKSLRECVTFAPQNLIADPPFSRLDLISCRNLLIYLEPEVQRKVLELFHFALNEGGYLFLGNAETIGVQDALFEAVSKKWRLYRRIGERNPVAVDFPIANAGTAPTGNGIRLPVTAGPTRVAGLAQQALLQDYAPAAVLVTRKHQVVYFHGPTSRYLNQPAGAPTNDVLALVRDGLRSKLRAALYQAAAEQRPVEIADAHVNRDDSYVRVKLTVKPLPDKTGSEALLLITFEDQDSRPVAKTQSTDETPISLTDQLEYELKATREELQSHIEEQEAGNEELQAANEEIMSVNEELQSTNEELETSKEELQSLNEELTTVNSQLKDKLEELEAATDDLTNLLISTDIATLFLDTECRIKRFTPACKSLFHLLEADVGRPIVDIRQKFEGNDLLREVERVLKRLTPLECEVRTEKGDWFIRRILPYRTGEHHIGGVVITFVNINERKRGEEKTRRLAAVMRDSNDAITVQDLDGWIISWNRGAEKMYGWSENEALTMNIAKIMPEGKREKTLVFIQGLTRGQSPQSAETQRLTKDGRILDVWMTITPLLDETGRINAIATTERDITERKRVELEIRQNEQNFRTLLESNPDAMIVSDEAGHIVIANKQAEQMFGYSSDELLRLNIEQLIPEEFRTAHEAHLRTYAAAPRSWDMDSKLTLSGLTRAGNKFPIEVSVSPINTPDGLRVAAAIRDVTERMQAEEALLKQKAFSDSLVETAQAIVLLLDSEGRVLQVNPYFEQLTGYRAEDVVGQDWFSTFLPENERATIRTFFHEVMHAGINPGHTNGIVAADGSVHSIEWRAKNMTDSHGNVIGLLNVGHDVTDRIETERALSAAKREAEHANAAKSRFLAAASHDLRQPLQTISLLNEVLARETDNPIALKALETQSDALRVIEGLIGAYLDMSKLEAGIIKPEFTQVCVAKLFDQLHCEFAPIARQRGIELRTSTCSALIRSDAELLRQILENLIGNAIKHTRPPGRVVIGARRRGTRILLQVWDTGSGIPTDQIESIFEEFHQLENPARDRQKGLGLGLAIARRLAHLLGHQINVRSTLGKGSVFEIEVRRDDERPTAQPVSEPLPVDTIAAGASETLLLIDDDTGVLDALRLLLESYGYQVMPAENGAQAMQQVADAEQPPQLIISDYQIPGPENGLEIIGNIRTMVGEDLPAILMTGDTLPERMRDAQLMNCQVLHKPARPDVLLPLLRQLLQ